MQRLNGSCKQIYVTKSLRMKLTSKYVSKEMKSTSEYGSKEMKLTSEYGSK